VIALDTETTGLDFHHGAKPYLVSICDEGNNNTWWEWDVNPKTRQPAISADDLREINDCLFAAGEIVLQNAKFDYTALRTVFTGDRDRPRLMWDWGKVHDTLLAGHLLASNHPHDLTNMAVEYLGINILPYEVALKEAVTSARKITRKDFKQWRIAGKDLPEMPSAGDNPWSFDGWLPRAVLLHDACEADGAGILIEEIAPKDHPWWTVCRDYCNVDSASTLTLFERQRELLVERGLWEIYMERRKLLPVIASMEARGITQSGRRQGELRQQFQDESEAAGRICVNVAKSYDYDLELPKGGSNNSLRGFLFDTLGLKSSSYSEKTGEPSMGKDVLDHWELTLPPKSKASLFVRSLRGKRKRDTALSYLDGYKRFWVPLEDAGWFVLYPSLNPTGTATLRFSSQNPNEQNISKQEGFNLRHCFGPAPGREWWSMDYKNLELRIPAYEAGEEDVVWVFNHPDDPPYYGSYHLLVADLLHPKLFKKHGKAFKEVFASTWYQWVKNGNFAMIYGAMEATADHTYHVKGAYRKLRRRFPKIAALARTQLSLAESYGYVETIPDKTLGIDRGYPLYCSRSQYGGVLPTVPLNYHVQGTAMWCTMKAMIRCHEYLQTTRDRYMVMQVHDEIVFDFPKGGTRNGSSESTNLATALHLAELMEQSGEDIGVPTPVEVTYHPKTWAEGETI